MAKQKPTDRDLYLKFSRPSNNCLLCNVPLNIEGAHPTLLEVGGREEAIRKDFCPDCWNKKDQQTYFSFWVTNRVNKPTAKERRLAKSERNEALWRLFSALHASEGDDLAPQLFLLAHLLMKYKVLTFTGSRDGMLEFTHPKLGETFMVEDLPLDSTDFVAIHQQIEGQVLDYAPEESPAEEQAIVGDDEENPAQT
ncbi:MAG: hypothetical protein JJU11_10480 [Candidatus Sumerlaeia bacterium]|nr:hypothetical protein [Candidatus Sumerlaeia bacterium]